MNIFQLYKQSGDPVNVWVCGKCGTLGWNKDAAERCCVPHKCKTCGKEEPTLQCNECFTAEQVKKETERFEKAEKVTEWAGWVYADGYGYKDGFFPSLEDLEECLASDEVSRPDYVWTCSEREFVTVDVDGLYEHIENEGYEDFDRADLNGTTELEAAIAVFEKANEGILSYGPDYSKAVLLTVEGVKEDGK